MNKQQFELTKKLNRYDEFMSSMHKSLNITNPASIKDFVPQIPQIVLQSKERVPVLMFEHVYNDLKNIWIASEYLPFNAPWFHGLLPAVLLKSLINNGYSFTDNEVKEAFARGLKLPAGGCGFCGVCGAAGGAGIVMSIVMKSTPFHAEERTLCFEASMAATKKLTEIGGSRCCRLSSYVAIDVIIKILKKFNYLLPEEKMDNRCPINKINDECLGKNCPFTR